METFDVADALAWTGGRLVGGSDAAAFADVVIDSRRVRTGSLFVAIVGPNHDAHRFLEQAAADGAGGFLIAHDQREAHAGHGPATIAIEDTTQGLGRLAAGHRQRFEGPLVGITGSSGKTTTKELCAAILRAQAPCLMTEGNLNNEFGLPLTLLRRAPEHASAVIELGMNHRGEIERLARIARPTIGLITNVGTAHIEYLGSQEEIALEKGDLFAALDADGVAAVNHDDARVVAQSERVAGRCIGYGTKTGVDVGARDVRFLPEGRFALTLETPWGHADIVVTGLGETTVINALAASTAALAAGAELEHVAAGLESYAPIRGRMAPIAIDGGITLIDDTYNANPQSMRQSLATLARLARDGRGFAVLGDMGELGDTREAAHHDMGVAAAELGIDGLYALGKTAECVVAGALSAGLDAETVRVVEDHAEAAAILRRTLRTGDWVLVKGSRAMQMERVVEALASGHTTGRNTEEGDR